MPDAPKILAFDTSAAHCAAALLSGDTVLGAVQEVMTKGQAERLMPLCEDLLRQSDISFSNLDAIGVGIGPGNFTGIRIAVSAARGLALGLGIPAVGVSTFDALALGASTPCICIVDAKRDQFFAQGFAITGWQDARIMDRVDLPKDVPIIGADGQAPRFAMAEAIARVTATRFETHPPRPAPLYLRPADAAPARDAPPEIIT